MMNGLTGGTANLKISGSSFNELCAFAPPIARDSSMQIEIVYFST